LVLLVSRRPNEYSFDVRSFQEFMAAEALCSADEVLEDRLLEIAAASAWRNVLLLAVGRLCQNLHPRAADVAQKLCRWLNEEASPACQDTLAGSRLALELMLDGAILALPRAATEIWQVATRLLELPDDELSERLSDVMLRWRDIDTVDLLTPLLQSIEEKFKQPEQAGPHVWRALFSISTDPEPDTREKTLALAEAHWPMSEAGKTHALEQLLELTETPAPWPRSGVSFASIPPSSLPWYMVEPSSSQEKSWLSPEQQAIARLLRQRPEIEFRFYSLPAVAALISLGHSRTEWTVLSGVTTNTPSWQMWRAAALFELEPGRKSLEHAIETMRRSFEPAELAVLRRRVSWPLSCALEGISSPLALQARAVEIRQGLWGELEHWQRCESIWRSRSPDSGDPDSSFCVTLDDASRPENWETQCWSSAPCPLPLGGAAWGTGFRGNRSAPASASKWLIALRPHLAAPAVAMLVKSILDSFVDEPACLDGILNESDLGPLLPHIALQALSPLLPASVLSAGWSEALDSLSAGGQFVIKRTIARHQNKATGQMRRLLLRSYRERPAAQGLLRLAGSLVEFPLESSEVDRLPDPADIENPWVRASLISLFAASNSRPQEQVENWVKSLPSLGASGQVAIARLADAVSGCRQRDSWTGDRLRLLLDAASQPTTRCFILKELNLWRARQPSGLVQNGTWLRLKLPRPLPAGSLKEERTAVPVDGPAIIEGISLQNLRSVRAFELETRDRPEGGGQWLVLLGDNGAGKTSVLRGIALALCDWTSAAMAVGHLRAPLIRHGKSEASCEVRLAGISRAAIIKYQDGSEQLEPSSAIGAPWVVGYGCRRGAERDGRPEAGPRQTILPLFDEDSGLINAHTWLRERQHRRETDHGLFNTVIKALCQILSPVGLDDIEADSDDIWCTGERIGGRIRLQALSDGFLTTIGWMVDLMARWVTRCEQLGLPVREGFVAQITGVVLVDEIDLHLHPTWQRRVIADVRSVFPRLTFVITTHQPMTLMGARKGEIWRLNPAPDGALVAHPIDLPPGIRVDQILTGPWFGLPSALDTETTTKLDLYRSMLANGVPSDSRERQELEADLRRTLGSFADTWEERAALEVAAEWRRTEARLATPEQKAQLQERTRTRLEQLRRARSGEGKG
jgi:hypothetical protein